MFIWDYEITKYDDGSTVATLSAAKVDKGKTFKVVRTCTTIAETLFWLKHFERLDLDSFKLCAQLEDDLKN